MATSGHEDPEDELTTRGIIRVGPVRKFGARDEDEYAFNISEQDQFEFRGRQRREMLWECTVYVTPEHEVRVYEHRNLERVPEGILECATAPIRSSEERDLSP